VENAARISLRTVVGFIALMVTNMANATTFDFNAANLSLTGGSAYNTINTSLDGIGLTITAVTISDGGNSSVQVTEDGLGVYLSESGNLGVFSSVPSMSNGFVTDGTDLDGEGSDEGLLFSFDQLVSLDFIDFDSFTNPSLFTLDSESSTNFVADNFNLTVDGVSVLTDYNANGASPLVSNMALFDEYGFSGIVGNNFLFWADADSDSFSINTLEVSTVPVPAAAWLFGSALLGLIGLSRRKKA